MKKPAGSTSSTSIPAPVTRCSARCAAWASAASRCSTQRWRTLQHVTASPGRIGLIAKAGPCPGPIRAQDDHVKVAEKTSLKCLSARLAKAATPTPSLSMAFPCGLRVSRRRIRLASAGPATCRRERGSASPAGRMGVSYRLHASARQRRLQRRLAGVLSVAKQGTMKAPASMAGAFCRSGLYARLARRHVHVQSILALDGFDREISVKRRLPALCVIPWTATPGQRPPGRYRVNAIWLWPKSWQRLNSAYSP